MDSSRPQGKVDALAERIRGAINDRDLEALTDCFAADYVNETPVHPSRGFRGRDQVRRNWEQIFKGVPDIRAEIVRSTADGDTAWSEWDMGGRRTDGTSFHMRGVTIYGLVDDEAAWCRFYLEPVDAGSEDINAATHRVVAGASAEGQEGSR